MNDRRDWSELCYDMLEVILGRLEFADNVHFGATCKTWLSVQSRSLHSKALQFPLMLLPPRIKPPIDLTWSIVSLMEVYQFLMKWMMNPELDPSSVLHLLDLPSIVHILHLPLPIRLDSRCFGATKGWVMMTHEIVGKHLLNFFTKELIRLPDTSLLPDYPDSLRKQRAFLKKAVMSSPPSAANLRSSSCVIVAIEYDGFLVFCRPGDQHWSPVHTNEKHRFCDAIFSDRVLFGLTDMQVVITFEFSPDPVERETFSPDQVMKGCYEDDTRVLYLVEVKKNLLLVIRHVIYTYQPYDDDDDDLWDFRDTVGFSVFKMNRSEKCTWEEVTSLMGDSLFLGTGCSQAKLVENIPGFKDNKIYFSDDSGDAVYGFNYPYPPCDFGIFNLKNKTIWKLSDVTTRYSVRCSPHWFMLNV